MSRYDIAKRKNKRQVIQFRPVRRAETLSGYMDQCLEQQVDLDTSNQKPGVVEQAAVILARKLAVPILINTEDRARLMRIAYGYRNIVSAKILSSGPAIIYDDVQEYYPDVVPLIRLRKCSYRA
jgi:hypothetical protein